MGLYALTPSTVPAYYRTVTSDYGEHLASAALQCLADATGHAHRGDIAAHFSQNQDDLMVALGSDEAASLLHPRVTSNAAALQPAEFDSLAVAIAVHRTAEEICRAGWTANDLSPIDLALVRFCGQLDNRRFIVDLLLSGRAAAAHFGADGTAPDLAGCGELGFSSAESRSPAERVLDLVDLIDTFGDFERPGLLRMLGDEALHSTGTQPRATSQHRLDADLHHALRSLLPSMLRPALDHMHQAGQSLLDAHLSFGPIWYRLASTSLLHRPNRQMFATMAREFSVARRFLVRVHQGPLAHLL